MNIELNVIDIYEVENDTFWGFFRLKNYQDIRLEFKCTDQKVEFIYSIDEGEDDREILSHWVKNETDIYAQFVFDYINEIKKFNDIPFFKGEIGKEHSVHDSGTQSYIVNVEYKEIPNKVMFKLYPYYGKIELFYQVPIAINSDGEYSKEIRIDGLLSKETIQRMWEPLRDKSKYRLPLLHMVR